MSGDRKYGNNKEACKAYKAAGRDERNRKRRMRRHLRDNPNDDAGRREFEKQFGGGVVSHGLSSRGKRKLKRAAALAAKAA
jgi:hypothetical protein